MNLQRIRSAKAWLYDALAPVLPSHITHQRNRSFDLTRKVRVELDGFSLYVMPNDYIGSSIIQTRAWEPHVAAVVRRELGPGKRFLDIGGNVGFYSMLGCSLVGPSGRVFTLEPAPQNLQLIYESQLANGFQNLTVFPYAASDGPALLRFSTIGSNGVVVTEHADDAPSLIVPAMRVDDLVPEPVDLVKIDVEAHERFALAGMSRLLASRPKLITEFHPWAMARYNLDSPESYLSFLRNDLGYELAVIEDAGRCAWMSDPDIIARWRSLGIAEAHLDLYCEPRS